ncbi:MAG TPA: lysylphosphatidylglycerol synthase domain-containing protein [Candidimonas sp.]|nr:lysylphosphatidylglycerol synthase domain-containing protein [Candidimonas sp.]
MKPTVSKIKLLGISISILLLSLIFLYVKPDGILRYVSQFPSSLLLMVLALMIANVFLVVYRYYRILRHFGFHLPWWQVFKASTVANIASLVVIPLMGQMVGRQTILRAAGISSIENAAIVAYERILVGATSATLALLGGSYLLGASISDHIENLPIWEILLIVVAAAAISFSIGATAFERMVLKTVFTRNNVIRISELVLITIISLALMLSCFALLFSVIAPSQTVLVLLSAAAVVSFAAGLPISFGGWGLREVASIYILGLLGVGSGQALAASILCGVLSIMSVLVFGPFVFSSRKAK